MLDAVFPAPAGINRHSAKEVYSWLCVPRASGDKPVSGQLAPTFDKCSPRQRG
ncbi:hypothetical protein H7768_000245 [Salmonella enterica subsp. enterica serovar Agama]|nr:hypothetical protein [Salmonella enterica subsp. enterica serovar Agama]